MIRIDLHHTESGRYLLITPDYGDPVRHDLSAGSNTARVSLLLNLGEDLVRIVQDSDTVDEEGANG
jgi:hypothetical protein